MLAPSGKDLRLSDHAPLSDAVATGEVIPLFVLDPVFFEPARARAIARRMQFLLDSMPALETALADRGSRLLVVPGRSVDVVPRLARAWQADRVVAHRWVEPFGRERDRRVSEALGAAFQLYEGETLHPPGTLRTATGRPYAVYTQFARAFTRAAVIEPPLPAPRWLPPLPRALPCDTAAIPTCEELGITRNHDLLAGGEHFAQARLRRFVHESLHLYADERDRMDLPGTSRLSADLKFGTISARQAWTAVDETAGGTGHAESFQAELIWREFTHSTLWDRPELLRKPFRPAFAGFPWQWNEPPWRAWVEGQTGYPIVDAAARQLLGEGFVHNRARMVAASFLTKHLLIDYRRGEEHTCTTSPTETGPRTTPAGNGQPAAVATPNPTSGSSTQSGRDSASIQAATTSAAGSPSLPDCPPSTSTAPGPRRPPSSARRASASARTIRAPSSTTTSPASAS
jgi:deoxyribodipyrimidine photo-lyase